ncbi:sulfite oxidase-like oxidoreductase [Paenibacillus sp. TRM 82003]|nr:sulfite oxidase-like oxidoreductase [Paenibacillus sp. TRM 82003]
MHQKADRLKRNTPPALTVDVSEELRGRVPPGQAVTERFPILHEGEVPTYDLDTWTLRVFGDVSEEKTFTYAELASMERSEVRADIHCVTRWTKLDTDWEGIRFRDFLSLLSPNPSAKYVMLHGDNDYETNVPFEDLLRDDCLLAFKYDGAPLTPKHGWPLRVVMPHRYFWKSAKWLRGIEFMQEDRPGFWERNGFHNDADPFREERFSDEPLPLPEDEWVHKDYD